MRTRQWVRIGAATALAVGATLATTAVPARAEAPWCDAILEMIDYEWDRYDFYANEANINAHDGNWSDYTENMKEAASWAEIAHMYEGLARHSRCY